MSAFILSGPALEPVTLGEAKAHLRVDHTYEDTLIQSLVTAARLHVETLTGRALIDQSWRVTLDRWPDNRIVALPIGPVGAVTAIRVYDADDIVATIDPSAYLLDATGVPARIALRQGVGWPLPGRAIAGIEIDFAAGYGPAATDVPEPLRRALMMLVAHWYEQREPVTLGGAALPVPLGAEAILSPYRARRL